MSGAGNDFVLIEKKAGVAYARLARKLCDRRLGVGADGLLVVSRRPRLALAYYNADGSAAFCGNGSRCAAWWMRREGWAKGRSFTFATSEGPLEAEMRRDGRAAIRMPPPKIHRLNMKVSALGRRFSAQWLDVGVPHAVVAVKNLDRFPVFEVGRALRFHKAFGKPGANVDFVSVGRPLRVRTYERGVENETLACGTGVTATAVVAEALGWAEPPVKARVRSGDVLTVSFEKKGGVYSGLWLEGPAKLVFSGEVSA